jgi:hypothetical protein
MLNTYTQSPQDEVRAIVEYRNAGGTVLGSYNSGWLSFSLVWSTVNDTRTAPVGTRIIRVRLLGRRNNGFSMDTYFDNTFLTTTNILSNAKGSFDINCSSSYKNIKVTVTGEKSRAYIIEKSPDGIDWQKLSEFTEQELDETNSFNITDNNTSDADIYYRLQGIEDLIISPLSITYSPACKKIDNFIIYPNPIKGGVFSIASSSKDEIIALSLFDYTGKKIRNLKVSENSLINVGDLPSGYYFLNIELNNENYIRKFIIN